MKNEFATFAVVILGWWLSPGGESHKSWLLELL